MKQRIIQYLPILFAIFVGLTSCNKEPEYFELEAPADRMKVAAETDTITLDLAKAKQEAVKFTWNEATDRGDGTKILYQFRLYQVGNKGNNKTDLVDIEPGMRSFSYTNSELNTVLRNWNVNPGDETLIAAQVIATMKESAIYMKPEISLFEFATTGYGDILYLFYTAGETILRGAMDADPENESVYTWNGELPTGTFWFSTNQNTGYPAYMRGADEQALLFQVGEGGTPFTVQQEGSYQIEVDLDAMRVHAIVQQ